MRERTRLTTGVKLGLRRASLRRKENWTRVELICKQDRWWLDAKGNLHNINKIDPDYQRALLHYWRVNAWRIRVLAEFTLSGSGGYAEDTLDSPYTMHADAIDWINEQPLVRALAALVAAQ